MEQRMPQGRVIVVGSINVDLTMRTAAIVAPGQTISGRDFRTLHGGKGGNQAVAAARAGVPCTMVARIGDDAYGAAAREALVAERVDDRFVTTTASTTGIALIQVADDGENAIVVVAGANGLLAPADVDRAFAEVETEAGGGEAGGGEGTLPPAVVLGLETPFDTMVHAAEQASARGWTVLLNPSPATALPAALLPYIDVLVPNEHEAVALGHPGIGGLIAAGAKAVVVTQGARGASIHTAEGIETLPAPVVDAIDTTGAGDAFMGTLAAALASGAALRDAVGAAIAAGAAATTRPGAR